MRTVNDIIEEINYCDRVITALNNYNSGVKKFEDHCDELYDAVGIINDYIKELGSKQVK